jgi:type I restriction enzyme R subunit
MEVVRQMFHGFDHMRFFSVGTSERLSIILQAEEFIFSREQGKERFINESTALSQLFALAVPNEDALALTDEIAFFHSVRARLLRRKIKKATRARSQRKPLQRARKKRKSKVKCRHS